MKIKRILLWTFLVVWMGVIFAFSNQPDSSKITKKVLVETVFKIEGVDELGDTPDNVNFVVRKCAHVTEFFILTLIVLVLLNKYLKSNKKAMIMAFVIVFLCAIGDEFHQYFVPGRTSSIVDVLIDSIGIVTAILIYIIIKHRKNMKLNLKVS